MSIVINGKSYSGKNITIRNNQVIIDGKDLTPNAKQIQIVVEGNIQDLEVDVCDSVRIIGEVGSVRTSSGDVQIKGDVKEGVNTTSGDVECKVINGSVYTTSGDVEASSIGGNVETRSGDVDRKFR